MKKRQSDLFLLLALAGAAGALCGCGIVPWWCLLFMIPAMIILEWRTAVLLLSAAVISFISGSINSALNKAALNAYRHSGSVSGIAVVRDHRATKVPGIILKSRVRMEFTADGREKSIPVLAEFPEDIAGQGFLYGDRFYVSGSLMVPEAAGFYWDGNKINGEIPPPYGENFLLYCEKVSHSGVENGFFRSCFRSRELLLGKLVAGISPEYRSMAARLFLGASDGADFEIRKIFTLSGIIHLFAVSGMHVGILAIVSGIMLIFLPFRARYILIAVITALYVLCSGLAVPALRAGMMIVCWCLCRAFLFKVPGWNILMLSFLLLCVFEPESITKLGTQYSYGITAALIFGAGILNSWCKNGNWQYKLMVPNAEFTVKQRRKDAMFRKFILFCSIPVLAFAAGAMLTMRHQKLFLPGSVFTNCIVTLLVPFLFLIFIVKLMIGWMASFIDAGCGYLIGKGFEYLISCADISLSCFDTVAAAMPGWWMVFLFYLLFFFALKIKWFYFRIVAAVLAILVLLTAVLHSRYNSETIIVVGGSSAHPPLVARLIPGEARAEVCNMPDSWSCVLAADELLRHGCSNAEIFFSGGKSSNNNGLKSFASRINITSLCLPETKRNIYFMNNIKNAGVVPETIPDNRNIVLENEYDFKWNLENNGRLDLAKGDDGLRVVLTLPDGSVKQTVIPWSNHVFIWQYSY